MGREPGYAEMGVRFENPDLPGTDLFVWILMKPEDGWTLVQEFGLAGR